MEKPLYQIICEELSRRYLDGQWAKGTCLPTEQELMKEYGVSRITIRHALTLLEERGYIRRVQGCGSVVEFPPQNAFRIGVAMPDFDDVFGTRLLKGIFSEAEKQNAMVILKTGYKTPQAEGLALDCLMQQGVQGIISLPLYDSVHYTDALARVSQQLPVVFVDRWVWGVAGAAVCTDNIDGIKMLYNLLRENGCHKIAFISSEPTSTAVSERLKAFEMMCTEAESNLVLTNLYTPMPGMDTPENALRDMERITEFFTRHPEIEGVIAHTYCVAQLVKKATEKLAISIPEKLSLVCFDHQPVDHGRPEIAHLRQDEYKIGTLAVRRLTEILQGAENQGVLRVKCAFQDAESYRRI